MIRASANDKDFWKEELEDKAVDFREQRKEHSRGASKPAKGGGKGSASASGSGGRRSRSRSRRGGSSTGRAGSSHPQKTADGRFRTTKQGMQLCYEFNRNDEGCRRECTQERAHVCEWCLSAHRAIQCPKHPGWVPPVKGRGKGKDQRHY